MALAGIGPYIPTPDPGPVSELCGLVGAVRALESEEPNILDCKSK